MAVRPITNPSFEDGTITGWTVPVGVTYSVTTAERTPFGQYTLRFTGSPGLFNAVSTTSYPVYPGKKITASCNYSQGPASSYKNTGRVVLEWYNSSNVKISESLGTLIFATGSSGWNQGTGMVLSSVTAEAPASSAYVKIGVQVDKNNNDWSSVDNFVWDYEALSDAKITSPTSAGIYQEGSTIYLRMSYAVPSGMEVTSSKYVVTNTITAAVLEFPADLTTSPWAVNTSTIPAGSWKIIGQIVLNSGETVTTDEVNFSVGDPPPIPTREYRASNSATSLILENFSALSAAIPSTAVITGAELVVDYSLQVLSRSKDKYVDVEASNPDIAFSIIPSGKLDISLLDKNAMSYTKVGSDMSADITIKRSDFTLDEEGISEGYKWTSFSSNLKFQAIVGSKDLLFGIGTISVQDFIAKSVGLKFTADTSSLPNTVEEGSGCVRFKLDTAKLRVYFDAGSVEYYFASPDKENILKGTLVAANVLNGDLRNADGSGVLQLSEDLELMKGASLHIVKDWTIHSQYPPTNANMVAVVKEDMKYNALPSYALATINRTRYEFITANFYGDERLNSIYGVNGVGRSFSYNGKDFYKIYTQPEESKDNPRHLAEHHLHLALGYQEGRVDMSVVGEPYNFDGALGASSWGIGDGVTGLLKLSGTLLGVFGSNSISGLSGTTVDNFAVQTISPKMGALEYTVMDMSYPVYANSYGIYTLSQTQQYGDYLGTPLSQDISPWLRPRLIRKSISDHEVSVAWPVRAKNQYRLAFADGHILTMTMNNGQQSAPTFSLQKYFTGNVYDGISYSQDTIVPAAVSSQLDHGGQERIHISNKQSINYEEVVIEGPTIENRAVEGIKGLEYSFTYQTASDHPPLSYSIVSGDVPSGLVFSSNGVLSGIPASGGTYVFTVRVTDANGLWDEVVETVTIKKGVVALATSSYLFERSGSTLIETIPAPFAGGSRSLAISSDGMHLAVGSSVDTKLRVGKLKADKSGYVELPVTGLPSGTVQGVDFSPDGQWLIAALPGSNQIRIYKVSADEVAFVTTASLNQASGPRFSRDGKWIVCGCGIDPPTRGIGVMPFNPVTGLVGSAVHPPVSGGFVQSSEYSEWDPSGKYIAACNNGGVAVWRFKDASLALLHSQGEPMPSGGRGVSWSPDGRYLYTVAAVAVAGNRIAAYQWNGESLSAPVYPVDQPISSTISDSSLSSDGKQLVIGLGGSNPGQALYVYDVSGTELTLAPRPVTTAMNADSVRWTEVPL